MEAEPGAGPVLPHEPNHVDASHRCLSVDADESGHVQSSTAQALHIVYNQCNQPSRRRRRKFVDDDDRDLISILRYGVKFLQPFLFSSY